MSFFGIPFLSTEDPPPMLKKNEKDSVFQENPAEEVPDEAKDEQNEERESSSEQENRAPVDEKHSALPEVEQETTVIKEELLVDVTPAQVEAMNPSPAPDRTTPLECDYDADPTELYQSLQSRNWDASIDRCKENAKEARTWVSRKEKNGKLRWRLLPLHAAVIFKATDAVIEALLAAYPRGAESKDDQGMLPLHLAFRNGSSESVVNLLLQAFPKSIEVKDRKGRIPLALAQASTSPNRDAFMRALERGPTYYATAAAATERAAVTAEQQTMFDAKMREKETSYEEELAMLRVDAEQKQMDYEDKIKRLEQDLQKTQETSQVLVDHVNTLEAQLSSRTDTERFLATRIAALDVDLKQTAKGKEDLEASLKAENEDLKVAKAILEDELKSLKEDHALQVSQLNDTKEQLTTVQGEKQADYQELKDNLATIQKEWASAKASEAILEAQLKKRIKSEKGLAGEVSFLASRLAESAHDSGESVGNYTNRVRTLEKERDDLRTTVKALTDKLKEVAAALDEMMVGQQLIVAAATQHEQNMDESVGIHNKLVSHARRHQELFESAQKEREELALAVQVQAEEAAKLSEERRAIVEAFELQKEQMEDAKEERKHLVTRVEGQRLEIQNVIVDTLSGIAPILKTNEDKVVDEMVKIVMSTDTADIATAESSPRKLPLSFENTLKRIDARADELECKAEPGSKIVAKETQAPVKNDNPITNVTSPLSKQSPTAAASSPKVKASCSVEETLKRIESRRNTPTVGSGTPIKSPRVGERTFNFEGVSTEEVEDEVQSVRDAP